jgi:hypothetical protein
MRSEAKKATDRRYFERHRTEIYARTKVWAEANPNKVIAYQKHYQAIGGHRASYLKRMYHLTVDGYNFLLEKQYGVCAVCYLPPAPGKFLKVDHDHSCCPGEKSCGKCIRGLLCSNCNSGLGMFKDNFTNLNMAIDYLSQYAIASTSLPG